MNYILDGHNVVKEPDLMKWAEWVGKAERHVAKETINDVEISTVFLGIDHSFMNDQTPVLFETMVFGGKFDQEQDRYCTWDEAVEGHKDMVEKVKAEATNGKE